MNVTNTSPRPASPQRADVGQDDDLDARILRAEQRLITREENLHRGVRELGARVRQGLHPWRLLIPALGVGAVLGGALWWRRGRRRSVAAPASPGVAAPAPAPSWQHRLGTWMPLVGLVWPMLPAGWRARVHPKVARLMQALGVPMVP